MSFATDRMEICKSCDLFRKITKTCSVCNCFMPIKSTIKGADCPENKWEKVAT